MVCACIHCANVEYVTILLIIGLYSTLLFRLTRIICLTLVRKTLPKHLFSYDKKPNDTGPEGSHHLFFCNGDAKNFYSMLESVPIQKKKNLPFFSNQTHFCCLLLPVAETLHQRPTTHRDSQPHNHIQIRNYPQGQEHFKFSEQN